MPRICFRTAFSPTKRQMNETRNLPEGRTNSLAPPSVFFACASKEFPVSPSARSAADERERKREKEGGGGGARRAEGHRCANSISPLLVPNLRLGGCPTMSGLGALGPLPPPPAPRPCRTQEGPTAIDPDLHAPNERDCQRKPTCRTRTCGNAVLRCSSRSSRLTPPLPPSCSPLPIPVAFSLVSSIVPRRDPPHLLPFLLFFLLLP